MDLRIVIMKALNNYDFCRIAGCFRRLFSCGFLVWCLDFCLGLFGFGFEFGDGGVVFGLGIIFKNDFLRCLEADDQGVS